MPFNSGTGITDHIDMLDKLIEVVVNSRHLASVVVNAGGTGHAVGDIIEIDATGATSTIVAQLEVTSISGSAIDGIRVYRSGAYTVDPTTTTANAQSGSSGGGTGATFDLTMSAAKWALNRRTQEAASAAVGTAGNGYNVNDILTVTNVLPGVQGFAGADATFTVATLTGGAGSGVATVTLLVPGNYEESPANDAATTNDGTGDDACELTVTWVDGTKAANDEQVCMLEGEGLGGADAIHVIIRPYTQVSGFDDAFNWALMGATGFNDTLPIHQQLGVNSLQINLSTGAFPAGATSGSYFVLKDDDADPDISWWLSWNGRRIILVAKVESGATSQYMSMYVGFLNQTATDTEYPYPLWICGNTSDQNRVWDETTELTGGIVEVIADSAGDPTGPGYLRLPDSSWLSFAGEISTTGTSRIVETEFCIYPFFNRLSLTGVIQKVSLNSDVDWSGGSHDIIPSSGVPGSQTILLKPTPGTGSDFYWLVPPMIIRYENISGKLFPDFYNVFGEIDGVFWFHTGGNAVVSEDRFELTTKRYTIFQNGNRTQDWSYFALDED